MATLTFISESGEKAGKITSRKSRTTVRSHVMRRRWAASAQTKPKTTLAGQEPAHSQAEVLEDRSLAEKSTRQYPATSKPASEGSASVGETQHSLNFCWHLNRSTDAFIYAGSYIDEESYGFFRHYSLEFHVIFCDEIQPVTFSATSICCSLAIQDNATALIHLICFTGASHEAASRSSSPQSLVRGTDSPSRTFQEALCHKSSGLALLNKILSQSMSSVSESSIACVLLLLASEAITGNLLAINAHRKGLMQMIDFYGGFSVLSPVMATLVSLTDVKSAAVQVTCPNFPVQPYLRHRFERHSYVDVPLSCSFFVEPICSRLSHDLRKCLLYARHVALLTEQLQWSPTMPSIYGIDDFIVLDHYLLSLRTSTTDDPLQECVRISLLLYSNVTLWKTPCYFGWVISLLTRLKSSLSALDWQTELDECPSLLLWMLFVGCSVNHHNSDEEAAWWLSALGLVISKLGLTQWDQASDILECFFYVERVNGRAWKRQWVNSRLEARERSSIRIESVKYPCKYVT